MSQKYQTRQQQGNSSMADASRKQWLDAVEKLACDEKIKTRIECLERQVGAHTLGNWQSR